VLGLNQTQTPVVVFNQSGWFFEEQIYIKRTSPVSYSIVDETQFVILVGSVRQRKGAQLLIESIQTFGGPLSRCQITLFEADAQNAPCTDLKGPTVQVLPLTVPDNVRDYYFAAKVYACAQAEALVTPSVQSLVWVASDCLVVKPPLLFDLVASFDAAVRPVHITNVGLLDAAPLNDYWKRVFEVVGVQDVRSTVKTFVDEQRVRAYFNSHALAVNPSKGLFGRWFELFETLVCDREYQACSCQDGFRQVFLHQALLSTLIVTELEPQRIRLLPPEYNYPYNLHQSIPVGKRAAALNDLVCFVYEDLSLNPSVIDDIEIHEPLRSWLAARTQNDAN
jgi:hypothetical protein